LREKAVQFLRTDWLVEEGIHPGCDAMVVVTEEKKQQTA
jgi:hypothetical protein